MNFKETLEESLDVLWNNRQYGGTNELPRKDYQPYSSSSGYSYPYQQGGNPMFPPTNREPDSIPSIPWPLETVTSDLADGFVYILSALKKLETTVKQNPTLSEKRKKLIGKYIKALKASLYIIKKVGKGIINVVNLSKNPSPQYPPNS